MLVPPRGPRPWRARRTGAERLELAAWVEFALVGLSAAGLASSAILLAHMGGICMDPGDPGCQKTDAPGVVFDVGVVLAGLWGIAVAALPVLLTRLYRRGRLPLAAAIAGLVAPASVACAATAILLVLVR